MYMYRINVAIHPNQWINGSVLAWSPHACTEVQAHSVSALAVGISSSAERTQCPGALLDARRQAISVPRARPASHCSPNLCPGVASHVEEELQCVRA